MKKQKTIKLRIILVFVAAVLCSASLLFSLSTPPDPPESYERREERVEFDMSRQRASTFQIVFGRKPVGSFQHLPTSLAKPYDQDYGSSDVTNRGSRAEQGIVIPRDEYEIHEAYRDQLDRNRTLRELSVLGHDGIDPQLVNDTELVRNRLRDYYYYQLGLRENDEVKARCQTPSSWSRRSHFPVCNNLHEISLSTTSSYKAPRLLTTPGNKCKVWRISYRAESAILKTLKEDNPFYPLHAYLRQAQIESLIMEKLSSSSRIIDIYGHCGLSILTEYASGGSTESEIMPTRKRNQEDNFAASLQASIMQQQLANNLTLAQKVDMALIMAESIAELHGYEGGVAIHGDVHPM